MKGLPFANELPYFKTGKSSAESWVLKTEKLIESAGGIVHTRLMGKSLGLEGIMIQFAIEGSQFKLTWPVLPVEKMIDESAALRQCGTMIYHDTKARINRIRIFGPKVVFADWLILENGQTLAQSHESLISGMLNNLKIMS